jgi:hypothetical protein
MDIIQSRGNLVKPGSIYHRLLWKPRRMAHQLKVFAALSDVTTTMMGIIPLA